MFSSQSINVDLLTEKATKNGFGQSKKVRIVPEHYASISTPFNGSIVSSDLNSISSVVKEASVKGVDQTSHTILTKE